MGFGFENLSPLQGALLLSANPYQAAEILWNGSFETDSAITTMTDLHAALTPVRPDLADTFAQSPTVKDKALVLYGLGSDWSLVQRRAAALFQERGKIKTAMKVPATLDPKKQADFAAVSFLRGVLQTKSPEFATWFMRELEPSNAFDFFAKLANMLAYFGNLSARLFVQERGPGRSARDFENWRKDQEELAGLSALVQAIRYLIYESRDNYPEALDDFHARLRQIGSSPARELLDTIERRATSARRFLDDLPEASSQSPEVAPSAA